MSTLIQAQIDRISGNVISALDAVSSYGVNTANMTSNDLTRAINSILVPVERGGTGATERGTQLLYNIGIEAGTDEPPTNGDPGTIYIRFI